MVGKPDVRMWNCGMTPWREVPPDLTCWSGDFVLQVGFGLKWVHVKFGMKPSNPGGLAWKTCFGFVSHQYLGSVLLHAGESCHSGCLVNGLQVCERWRSLNETHSSYGCVKRSCSVTSFSPRICPPGFEIARWSCVWPQKGNIPNVPSKGDKCYCRMSFLFAHAQWWIPCFSVRFTCFLRFDDITVALTTMFLQQRRFRRQVVLLLNLINFHGGWEPP